MEFQQIWDDILGRLIVIGLLLGPSGLLALLILILICCRVNPVFLYPLVGLLEQSNRKSKSSSVFNGNIKYGWNGNPKGLEYVPVKIGDKDIVYGWNGNPKGLEYVPVRIGDEKMEYGWNGNPKGLEYVPVKIGDKDIVYGWNGNPKGLEFVPDKIR